MDVDEFFFLRQADDHGWADVELFEGFERGVKLAESAVDEDDIGVELLALAGVAVSSGDDFTDGHVVIIIDGLNFVTAVLVFEWLAVHEADFRADGFSALEVGDIDGFDASHGAVEAEGSAEAFCALAWVGHEGFGLGLPVVFFVGALLEFFNSFDLIAEGGGIFEAKIRGGLLHLGVHFAKHDRAFRAEELDESVDVTAVGLGCDLGGAGAGALFDGVEQAGAEESVPGVVGVDVEGAGAEFENALEELNGFAQGVDADERAEGFGAFVFGGVGVSGDVDAGVVVAEGDDEVGEGFVVEEPGVEAGLDVFDQPVFGKQSFPLGLALNDVDLGDEVEHGRFLRAQFCRGDEIGGDPIFEVACLADVEDHARSIFHEIDARQLG